jgi:hypothetical protein
VKYVIAPAATEASNAQLVPVSGANAPAHD